MKKLALSREIVRWLDDDLLGKIKGAGGTGPGATVDCGGGTGGPIAAGPTSVPCCVAGKPDG